MAVLPFSKIKVIEIYKITLKLKFQDGLNTHAHKLLKKNPKSFRRADRMLPAPSLGVGNFQLENRG